MAAPPRTISTRFAIALAVLLLVVALLGGPEGFRLDSGEETIGGAPRGAVELALGTPLVAGEETEVDLDDLVPHELTRSPPLLHLRQRPRSTGRLSSLIWSERLHRPPIG